MAKVGVLDGRGVGDAEGLGVGDTVGSIVGPGVGDGVQVPLRFQEKREGEVGDMRVHVSQLKEGTVLVFDHRSLIAPTHNINIVTYAPLQANFLTIRCCTSTGSSG